MQASVPCPYVQFKPCAANQIENFHTLCCDCGDANRRPKRWKKIDLILCIVWNNGTTSIRIDRCRSELICKRAPHTRTQPCHPFRRKKRTYIPSCVRPNSAATPPNLPCKTVPTFDKTYAYNCNEYVSIRSKLWNNVLRGAHRNLCFLPFSNHPYALFRIVRHDAM